MSSILPHLPLVSPTLFSSELLSLAVCLACDGPEAAMLSSPVSLLFFLLPCPDPAILSTHTQTHTLYHSPLFSFCLSFALYIIPVCVFSLMPFASFFRSNPYLLSSQVQCLSKTQSRHTYKEKKKKKKCMQAHHLYFISSFSLHPLLWLFVLNLLARNEKASEKKVTITWTRWHAVVKTRNTLLWHKQNRTNFNL